MGSFWYASVRGIVFVVGGVGTFLLLILFLCTTRRHERPWYYWYFVLVLLLATWCLEVPLVINQRTCFRGGVHLYTGISLAHIWFVLVGVILLFLSFVVWYIDHYLIIGIKISMWKVGLGGEWFWCLRSSSTSVPGEMLCSYRPDGLFSCRRCSLCHRGQVDALGRPHGEGSWADEFFYGECLQGIWVEGEPLGKFQSRETGTNAAFNQLCGILFLSRRQHARKPREAVLLSEETSAAVRRGDGRNLSHVLHRGKGRRTQSETARIFSTSSRSWQVCAEFCPEAVVVLIVNPVNSVVGATFLDMVRANMFVHEFAVSNIEGFNFPVIGGRVGSTIIPLVSQDAAAVTIITEKKILISTRRCKRWLCRGGGAFRSRWTAAFFASFRFTACRPYT